MEQMGSNRRHIAASIFILGSLQMNMTVIPAQAADFTIIGNNSTNKCDYYWPAVKIKVDDWHQLTNTSNIERVVNLGRDALLATCSGSNPNSGLLQIEIVSPNIGSIVVAQWHVKNGRYVSNNFLSTNSAIAVGNRSISVGWSELPGLIEGENAKNSEEAERQNAIRDCGDQVNVSGGPWLSSTYKMAAQDEAKRGMFCVKKVEYVSDAPNPFGGKAARANFIGYVHAGQHYVLKTETRDFAY